MYVHRETSLLRPIRGEMVSDASPLYPRAWGRAVGWALRAVVQQEEMASPGVKVGGRL